MTTPARIKPSVIQTSWEVAVEDSVARSIR